MDVNALARPRFKSCVEPIIDADDGLFLLQEGHNEWLPHPVYAALAPWLDGNHDVEAIFEALSDGFPAEDILAALDHLKERGFLSEDAAPGRRAEAAFWERSGVLPSVARARLRSSSVSLVVFGEVDVDGLPGLLAEQGMEVRPDEDLVLVVTDDYLRPELERWNGQALASGTPWFLCKPVGITPWMGPVFIPGRSACWHCLAQRLRGHRRLEGYLAGRREGVPRIAAPPAHLPTMTQAALAEAATQIVRWRGSGGESELVDRVVATDTLTLERSHHVLTRRPQCPSCGSATAADGRTPRPVRLQAQPIRSTADGGHRAGDPHQVLERLSRHLSPITGIVSRLDPGERTRATPGDPRWLTPTFAADHNFSDMYDQRFFLKEGMRRRSGGKGKSPAQARISALAESLERYSGVFDGTEPRTRSTLENLNGAAIHPNECMGYSQAQYARRDEYNRRGHKAYWVPEPFREDEEIEWSPLWSLTHERTRYLPTSYCYFGYRSPDPLFARGDSNGCAAGSVLEEAVLQGLLELVERDAVALWWYNRLSRPGVDLEQSDDPYGPGLVRHYQEVQRELWVLDVTSDLGIPTFAALSRRVDQAEEDVIYGFGTHLDPNVALARALTEVNQSLEAVPLATGPDTARTYRGGEEAVRWWRTVRVQDADYLRADGGSALTRISGITDLSGADLRDDIDTCVARLAAQGIEVLVLDQTRPDVAFPVVRVVAPGLRHFWARFGPGRLYDVPLREGWLTRSRDEGELNPFVIQF